MSRMCCANDQQIQIDERNCDVYQIPLSVQVYILCRYRVWEVGGSLRERECVSVCVCARARVRARVCPNWILLTARERKSHILAGVTAWETGGGGRG